LTAPSTALTMTNVLAGMQFGAQSTQISQRTRSTSPSRSVPRSVPRPRARTRSLGRQSPRTCHAPRSRSATRKPWCERPCSCDVRVTLRQRRRGRSHHGLLTDNRRRGVQTGGTERPPFTADAAANLQRVLDFAWRVSAEDAWLMMRRISEDPELIRTTYVVGRLSGGRSRSSHAPMVPTSGVSCRY
jgi:hypothetical protein